MMQIILHFISSLLYNCKLNKDKQSRFGNNEIKRS